MNACSFNIIIPSSGFERSCIFVTHLLMIANLARSHSKIMDCLVSLTFFFSSPRNHLLGVFGCDSGSADGELEIVHDGMRSQQ